MSVKYDNVKWLEYNCHFSISSFLLMLTAYRFLMANYLSPDELASNIEDVELSADGVEDTGATCEDDPSRQESSFPTTDMSEDMSLLQVFLPEYSQDCSDVQVELEALHKRIDSDRDLTKDQIREIISFLSIQDPLYNNISIELLTESLTEGQFMSRISNYFKCKESFLNPAFASDGHGASTCEYLKWASNNKAVKGHCNTVPLFILPKGLSADLTDVRVNCYGSDDKMYEKNRVLREKVARGNCFVEFFGKEKLNGGCVIRGLSKFSGGYWDDDDVQNNDHAGWSRYFLSTPEKATSVVAMEKVNGEAAHVSVRLLGAKFLIFCGSKNVHLLISKREHLTKYTDQRYSYARVIGESFCDILDGMEECQRVRLLGFLAHTGFTAVFELLQPRNQHIVDLSALASPILKFITWVPCQFSENRSLCSMPPNLAIDLASYLGLSTAYYSVIPIRLLAAELSAVRTQTQSEGAVLYFLDAKQQVIGLLKFKSIWYILLRAVREIIKFQTSQINKKKATYANAKDNGTEVIRKRFTRINKSLKIELESFIAWQDLCIDFFYWVFERVKNGKICNPSADFPKLWKNYLSFKKIEEPPILQQSLQTKKSK